MTIPKEIAANLDKLEVAFDPSVGWPNGSDLYYECLICGDLVHSSEDDECRWVMFTSMLPPEKPRPKEKRMLFIYRLCAIASRMQCIFEPIPEPLIGSSRPCSAAAEPSLVFSRTLEHPANANPLLSM
jgi:hypothetical protein